MYAGHIACCPLLIHDQYVSMLMGQTDRRTPDSYIVLSARCSQHNALEKVVEMIQKQLNTFLIEWRVCQHAS